MFSASFSFGIVKLGLSSPAAVECNECMVSVRVVHFGLFTHHLDRLDSLYIQQGPQLWSMTNAKDKESGGWFCPEWELH